jgi:hypothetical protein
VEAVLRIDSSWLRFVNPSRIVQATDAAGVDYTIATVEQLARADSAWAVGFVSYEAGAAYGLRVHDVRRLPLAWFAISIGRLRAGLQSHQGARRCRRHLPQANYTFRLEGRLSGESRELFASLARAQRGRYSLHPDRRSGDLLCVTRAVFSPRPPNEGRARRDDADDVCLWNENGEVTESTIANIVVELSGGVRVTPPVDCGLLAGTFRAELLERGENRRVVRVEELSSASRIWLINSVQGWRPASLVG